MRLPTRRKIRTLDEAKQAVSELVGAQKASTWWKLPNPHLGNISPDYLLRAGRDDKVFRFIEARINNDNYD